MGPRAEGSGRGAVKVLIADAQKLFSGALGAALSRRHRFDVLEDRPCDTAGVLEAAVRHNPDVVILDYWLDQGEAAKRIVDLLSEAKVLVVSGIYGPGQVEGALASGAAGFLPKTVSVATVADAIRRAHRGERLVYEQELRAMVQRMDERQREAEEFTGRLTGLSAREMQVLVLLGKGKLIADIARELGISQPTVTGHINRMLKKTGARSQAEVLAMARVAGAIQT